jgi:phosphoserine phosphatase
MRPTLFTKAALVVALLAPSQMGVGVGVSAARDPLPSWRDTAPKKAIVAFVGKVTRKGGRDFVPPPERVAVFDNDGTLWGEKPLPAELVFAFDRIRELAPQHPEWKTNEPFASVLKADMKRVAQAGKLGAMEIIAATHAGMTTDEFEATVREWMATARHPVTERPYTSMVYQPMLELLVYLRANGFKTFIVSGGGVEFMRPWAEAVYGIPPEQVIGSAGKVRLERVDGVPVLRKLATLDLLNNKDGKPVGIQSRIGRRPIAAFGNSDGDREMLEWTTAGSGARLGLLVHHDDAKREFAYDRQDRFQKLDAAWDEAIAKGWVVVSMKDDWKTIYPRASRTFAAAD